MIRRLLIYYFLCCALSAGAGVWLRKARTASAGSTVTRIGSVAQIDSGGNSGSQAVTVGTGASLFVVCASGWQNTINYFTSGSVTIAGAAMTPVSTSSDASTSFLHGACFYKTSPATGSQTLAWDWVGTSAPDVGTSILYASYSGSNTTTPARDTYGTQNNDASTATDTMTAETGDLIISWQSLYNASSFSWTGATKILDSTTYNNATASWAETSPTGNQQVTCTHTTTDGSLTAMVIAHD